MERRQAEDDPATSGRVLPVLVVVIAACVLLVLATVWSAAPEGGRGESVGEPAGERAHAEPPPMRLPEPVPVPKGAQPLDVPPPAGFGSVGARAVGVRHADGEPAVGVRVAAVVSGLPVLPLGPTGDDATVRFPDVERATAWVAGGSDRLLAVEAGAGEVLVLPAGEVVAGRVLVDGEVPREPLELALQSHHTEPAEPGAAVLDALAAPSSQLTGDVALHAQRTGQGGTFRFSALAQDWRGSLHVPQRFLSGERWGRVTVRRPADDLLVELTTAPLVSGKAVLPDGAPAVGARAVCTVTGETWPPRSAGTTGADGAFALPCGWRQAARVTLQLRAADDRAGALVELADVGRERGVEVGEVVLEPLRPVRLRVVDPAQQPIAGAIAVAADGFGDPSAPTGEDGRTTLVVRERAPAVEAHALRHGSAQATPPADAEQELVVVLGACAVLEVLVEHPRASALVLVVESHGSLLEGEQPFTVDPLRKSLGVSEPTTTTLKWTVENGATIPTTGSVALPAGGRVVLSCLRPHVPFDVRVEDPYGKALWTRQGLSLAPGEALLLTATIELPARTVAGVVRGPAGVPVAGATLYLRTDLERGDGVLPGERSDADGRFAFEDVHGDALTLEVLKQGFEKQVVSITPAAGDRVELEIDLQPGVLEEWSSAGEDG